MDDSFSFASTDGLIGLGFMTANGIVASLVAKISGSAVVVVSHMFLFKIGGKNALLLSSLTPEIGLFWRLTGRLENSLLLPGLTEMIGGVMVEGLGDGSLSPVWILGLPRK